MRSVPISLLQAYLGIQADLADLRAEFEGGPKGYQAEGEAKAYREVLAVLARIEAADPAEVAA